VAAPRLGDAPLGAKVALVAALGGDKRPRLRQALRSFFGDGATAGMSVIALIFMFAWMNQRNAGYPIGGSKAIIDLIVERFRGLGGTLRTSVKVDKIIVEDDLATGVHLTTG